MEEIMSIEFGQAVPQQYWSLSDEEFLPAVGWASKPRGDLMKGAQAGDLERFGQGLTAGLKAIAKQKKQTRHSLEMMWSVLWSAEKVEDTGRTADLIHLVESASAVPAKSKKAPKAGKKKKAPDLSWDEISRLLYGWLEQVTLSEPMQPFELLLLMELLENVGYRLAPATLISAWRACLCAAVAHCFKLEETDFSETPDDQILLVSGEVPWRASFLFAGVAGAKNLRQLGQQNLRDGFFERTDTDGTPHADMLSRIDFWLATMTRSLFIGQVWKKRLWDKESLERFQLTLQVLVATSNASGKLALCPIHEIGHAELLSLAAYFSGLSNRSAERMYLKALNSGKKKRSQFFIQTEDYAANQSDWSALAVMRNYWSDSSNLLMVTWNGDLPAVSLTALGKQLLEGRWEFSLTVDGTEVSGDGEWSAVCWNSDEDADYLELQMDLEGGYTLDRQILLPRNQHFVFLSDIVNGSEAARLEYRSLLPVASGFTDSVDEETHELSLKTKGLAARVFPLGLPQDRDFFCPGSLSLNERGQIELHQAAAEATALYVPLVIDWEPDLKRKPADWQSLTVSEAGKISPRDVASGHRLRIGKHQLLVYRSLKKGEVARAVLGHHTSYESVIGRFDSDGELTPLLFVE